LFRIDEFARIPDGNLDASDRTRLTCVGFDLVVVPIIFGNWLGGGGGAPVWWPVTLYSYYPQQPLFKPADKPRKHLSPHRRKDRKGRRPRRVESGLVEQDYAELIQAVAQMLRSRDVEPLPSPVQSALPSPIRREIVEAVLIRRRAPVIVEHAERFVQALREDAEVLELLELGLL